MPSGSREKLHATERLPDRNHGSLESCGVGVQLQFADDLLLLGLSTVAERRIQRDDNQSLQIGLDPLTTIPLDKIIYVIILGAENF